MGATYNASVANLVDPLSNSPLNSPSHSTQHTEINDALQALATYTAYTPTFTGITLGNATVNFEFTQFNKLVFVRGSVTLGSTSSVTGGITFTLPVNASTATRISGDFMGDIQDTGTANFLMTTFIDSATIAEIRVLNASGTYLQRTAISSTVPHTWASTDVIRLSFWYQAA